MTVLCRPAGPDDVDGIATVRIRSWQAGYAGIVPQFYLDGLTPAAEAERWRSRELRPGNSVAEVGGEIVGWSAVGPYNDEEEVPPPAPGSGEIYAIYVLPEHWGTGVGRALMAYSLDLLAADGLTPVLLWVLTENARARRFYEAAGFAPDGAAHTYTVAGTDLPEVRYRYPA
jgi:ribosomal protein S18 acetylase RimI-like enzyme